MQAVRRISGAMACLALLWSAFAPLSSAHAQAQSPDSIAETYQDWTVRCQAATDGPRRCWMSQSLQRSQDGERVLVIEIAVVDDGPLLVMVVPFGLLLEHGARLTSDGTAITTLPFHTCRPAGCFIRTAPNDALINAMRRGDVLTVGFQVADNSAPFDLSVSLSGFSAAYNRLQALADT